MSVRADNSGFIKGRFTLPSTIPAGVKRVEIIGERGSRAAGQFIGKGTITTQERRRITTTERYDPLAQTFMLLAEGRHIAGVGLYFVDKGDKPITVQIRTVQTGLPTGEILAQTVLMPQEIVQNGETKALFDPPLFFEALTEYAMVILTDDNRHSLAIAEIGQYDASKKQYITEQGYSVGVLLSSSNASTWTPHNNADLKFTLYGARFEPEKNYPLGTINFQNHTDFFLQADVESQSALTHAHFSLQDTDEHYTFMTRQAVRFQEPQVGEKALSLQLSGTPTQSPIIYPNPSALLGTLAQSATYISRAVIAGSGDAIVVLETLAPSGSAVLVEMEINGVYQSTTPENGEPLGDGWIRQEYKAPITGGRFVRVKITLTGTSKARPKARNLRMITT